LLKSSSLPFTLREVHYFQHADNLTHAIANNRKASKKRQQNQEVSMSGLQGFPRITPFLWFDSNAEEAVNFYLSIFKNSRRLDEQRANIDDPRVKKGVLTVAFELDGQKFTALNGGPLFKFTEAVSFVVRCETQQEVDDYWSKLTAGGSESQCGWLKDKFGLSWQIVPERLPELIKHPKAMLAMMQMKKLDIAELERAAQS
jgi:predicted 3-demethylubiquinone-9 3-methyltransferase (glyoxalase superfamily)